MGNSKGRDYRNRGVGVWGGWWLVVYKSSL